jgi:glycosyltransferase involved in cell wall biosynthesis
VVPLDVDMQDPPEVIEQMLVRWRDGFEVVYGVRRNRRADSLPKRLTADLYYRAHNWLASDKIPEHAGDFRLLDRKVVDTIRRMPERNRFMKGMFAWGGFRQTAVEYERVSREVGTSKFNYWKLWTLALDGITSTSTAPLRIWSYIGVVIALASLIYAGFVVVNTVLFGVDVAGYPVAHGRQPVPGRRATHLAGRPWRIYRAHPDRDEAATDLCGAVPDRDGRDRLTGMASWTGAGRR